MKKFTNLGQSFVIALNMLRLHKMRAFLTMLGVIIGVMAVSIVILISSAFKEYLKSEFSSIGSDTIYLSYAGFRLQEGESAGSVDGLELSDVKYITERVPEVEIACAYREAGSQSVKYKDETVKSVKTTAIDQEFLELNKVKLVKGRLLNANDDLLQANVCIITEDLEKALFFGKPSIGETVQVQGLNLVVAGVMKSLSLMGDRDTKTLLLPLATANSKWLGGNQIDLILMRARDGNNIDAVMDKIWQKLMIKSNNKAVYDLTSSQAVLNIFTTIISTIGTVLSGIAALSLLVGGIGIMNIMLVSVTERTREIGLRKALGAKRGNILLQFTVEAATLSLVGGLIGMGLAWSMGLLMTLITAKTSWPKEGGLSAPFPIVQAFMAAGFSAFIGVVFGFFPAYKAAMLDPIVALRSE